MHTAGDEGCRLGRVPRLGLEGKEGVPAQGLGFRVRVSVIGGLMAIRS